MGLAAAASLRQALKRRQQDEQALVKQNSKKGLSAEKGIFFLIRYRGDAVVDVTL